MPSSFGPHFWRRNNLILIPHSSGWQDEISTLCTLALSFLFLVENNRTLTSIKLTLAPYYIVKIRSYNQIQLWCLSFKNDTADYPESRTACFSFPMMSYGTDAYISLTLDQKSRNLSLDSRRFAWGIKSSLTWRWANTKSKNLHIIPFTHFSYHGKDGWRIISHKQLVNQTATVPQKLAVIWTMHPSNLLQ